MTAFAVPSMLTQEEAVEIRVMARRGEGVRSIAKQLSCSRNTVRRYLRDGEACRYGPLLARPCKLDEFKAEHADIFEMYESLVQENNDKLEKAEKIVRAHEVTCGPFVLYQWQKKFDAEKLYDAVQRDEFLRLGGKIETIPVYTIDKNIFEAKMAQSAIPPQVLEVVVKVSPRYKAPDKLST